MAYSCGYPNTMNRKGPSPLKARYTTSGDQEEIKVADLSGLAKGIKAVASGGDKDSDGDAGGDAPTKFKSNAQRKAVWASKNEKKNK